MLDGTSLERLVGALPELKSTDSLSGSAVMEEYEKKEVKDLAADIGNFLRYFDEEGASVHQRFEELSLKVHDISSYSVENLADLACDAIRTVKDSNFYNSQADQFNIAYSVYKRRVRDGLKDVVGYIAIEAKLSQLR